MKGEKGGGLKIEGVTGKMYKLKKSRSPVFKKKVKQENVRFKWTVLTQLQVVLCLRFTILRFKLAITTDRVIPLFVS